jgi:hypothetical protein
MFKKEFIALESPVMRLSLLTYLENFLLGEPKYQWHLPFNKRKHEIIGADMESWQDGFFNDLPEVYSIINPSSLPSEEFIGNSFYDNEELKCFETFTKFMYEFCINYNSALSGGLYEEMQKRAERSKIIDDHYEKPFLEDGRWQQAINLCKTVYGLMISNNEKYNFKECYRNFLYNP